MYDFFNTYTIELIITLYVISFIIWGIHLIIERKKTGNISLLHFIELFLPIWNTLACIELLVDVSFWANDIKIFKKK